MSELLPGDVYRAGFSDHSGFTRLLIGFAVLSGFPDSPADLASLEFRQLTLMDKSQTDSRNAD